MSRPSARLLWALKLLLGLGLLAWLVTKVDGEALLTQLRSVHLGWLLAMIVMPHIGILISCIKWQRLLAARGTDAPLPGLFRLYLIGTFFSSFFPSMIGGDVVRAYQLRRYRVDAANSVASILMERLTGIAGLFSLLPLALTQTALTEAFPELGAVIAVIIAAFVVGCMIVLRLEGTPRLVGPATRPRGTLRKITDLAGRTREQVMAYRGHGSAVLASYLWSVVFYVLAGFTVWLASRAVDAEADIMSVICVVPIVLLAALIPVSVNGLGVLEAGYVIVLGTLGVSQAEALTMALLLRLRLVLSALAGGLVFLADRGAAAQAVSGEGQARMSG